VVLADALRRRGVPVVHQAAVVAGGRTFHLDLAVPDASWGVELDIHPEHRSVEGHAADAERRRRLHREAWQVEVVTEQDMARPEQVADDLAELYRLRARHPSSACGSGPHPLLG
jgi:hypothetical protein